MVFSLSPQSIQIRCRFNPPPALIDDYEVCAAIGLILQYLNRPLSEKTSVQDIQKLILSDKSNTSEEKLYNLIKNYTIKDQHADWYDMIEFSYNYKERM